MPDILSVGFLKIALIGALLSAAATSAISVFVTLKKISYMGEAFSHIAFAGVAIALLLGLNMTLTNLVFVGAVALLIAYISKKYKLEEVNLTVIFLSVSMATAIILISFNKQYVDITSYLFGNVLLVSKGDLYKLGALLTVNLLFVIMFFKELVYIAYNQEIASIYGIPVKPIYYMFVVLLAMNIIIALKIIGIILIVAELILPGITALNITKKIKFAVLLSIIIGVVSAFAGFYFSCKFDIPSGASIVMAMFIIFVLSLVYSSFSSRTAR